jgi:hypothetical protein
LGILFTYLFSSEPTAWHFLAHEALPSYLRRSNLRLHSLFFVSVFFPLQAFQQPWRRAAARRGSRGFPPNARSWASCESCRNQSGGAGLAGGVLHGLPERTTLKSGKSSRATPCSRARPLQNLREGMKPKYRVTPYSLICWRSLSREPVSRRPMVTSSAWR